MASMLLCRKCDRYQSHNDTLLSCEFCGSDDVWREDDRDDCTKADLEDDAENYRAERVEVDL